MEIILDSETTGVGSEDQVIELAIINAETAETLFHSYFKPTVEIHPEAAAVNGLSMDDLSDAPSWPDLHDQVCKILEQADNVLIYNADFDRRLMEQTASAFDLELPDYQTLCVMKEYAWYWGDFNVYRKSYTWQKLIDACNQQDIDLSDLAMHTALGDCIATARLKKVVSPKIIAKKEGMKIQERREQKQKEAQERYKSKLFHELQEIVERAEKTGDEYPY